MSQILTDGNDYITATQAEVYGLNGNDRIFTTQASPDLYGGNGNDFLGNNGTGVMFGFGGDGNDTVHGGTNSDYIYGELGNDLLVGGEFTYSSAASGSIVPYLGELSGGDYLDGGAGRDSLWGLDGDDTLLGGDGDDNNAFTITVKSYDGADTYWSTIKGGLYGGDGDDYLDGGRGDDYLDGGADNDTLIGGLGNDTLDGGVGTDSMAGGDGDDLYLVSISGDLTIEAANQGLDTVRSTISWTLSDNIERLELQTGANGTGNALNNTLVGNSGNNVLNGAAGGDYMRGGAGDDIYYVDNIGDRTAEAAGGGSDTVRSSITWTLAADVERLELTGTAGIGGTGNALNNTIVGNGGNNLINGGAGKDYLVGGAGNDTFFFNTALGASNIDTISAYNVAEDTIRVENGIFTGLAAGWLTAGAFHTGSAAADASDRIIYNKITGALLFDKDGVGGAAAVHFATISPNLAMTANEFFIV